MHAQCSLIQQQCLTETYRTSNFSLIAGNPHFRRSISHYTLALYRIPFLMSLSHNFSYAIPHSWLHLPKHIIPFKTLKLLMIFIQMRWYPLLQTSPLDLISLFPIPSNKTCLEFHCMTIQTAGRLDFSEIFK